MSVYKLIQYFSSPPVAFGFQPSSPHDSITLNPANTKTCQSISDFQLDIGMAAHATLDMVQPIRTAVVDTIASPHDSDVGVIPFLLW